MPMGAKKPTIGLALGSGGARGFAHIGVLKTLTEAGVHIDYLAGSSMGALVATMYGVGHSVETMEIFAKHFKRKYYLDFTVSKQGLIAGQKIESLIRLLAKRKKLESLFPPVQVVATDLLSGQKVVMTKGDVAKAVRASLSIPGIFVPVQRDGQLLVDGGVVERVPVSVVRQMGADIVIAVDVSFFRTTLTSPSIYEILMQTMDVMGRELARKQEHAGDILLRPILKHSSPLDFSETDQLIKQGADACRQQLPGILKLIDQWR
ncbi:patatin-like phospholipase family protein [Shouchella clausii]|nr:MULTISPECIES: patatin-like phospholipase family protein [Shouchella]MBU3230711.1 patatin-like phospholipase family protein [Shouchella clausii]MBU3263214.1 patatin-like phospholipase family protein [Shouchella clausii]MBU3505679.1 patatin-like phospholipase family protein [Shouchella clausii]MBU3532856.1 patatin-like phospholipase family protein [Shouchella clausii]MBX0309721.1 patatin-like phospholipase family protein [Shouchella clausii]